MDRLSINSIFVGRPAKLVSSDHGPRQEFFLAGSMAIVKYSKRMQQTIMEQQVESSMRKGKEDIQDCKNIPVDVDAVTARIAAIQKENGEIPWSEGDKTDPWDHVEAAMGLTIGGRYGRARQAFDWLRRMQLEDGSWYSAYKNGQPEDCTRDTNMATYLAVGLYHYFLITGDHAFVESMWDTVRAGIEFALKLQQPTGEIHWALSPAGIVDPKALLTGSSSVYMSLKCAVSLALVLEKEHTGWVAALTRLKQAIATRPHLFDQSKSRFSMDGFYPVLTGAVTGAHARQYIDACLEKFFVAGQGVKCVSDEPWITVAETSELCLAIAGTGDRKRAARIFELLRDYRYPDGSYWCGFTIPERTIWPEEKISWTNAVVLLAADAIYRLTPAAGLFDHDFWETADRSAGLRSALAEDPENSVPAAVNF
jgi:hypothetical protein